MFTIIFLLCETGFLLACLLHDFYDWFLLVVLFLIIKNGIVLYYSLKNRR